MAESIVLQEAAYDQRIFANLDQSMMRDERLLVISYLAYRAELDDGQCDAITVALYLLSNHALSSIGQLFVAHEMRIIRRQAADISPAARGGLA